MPRRVLHLGPYQPVLEGRLADEVAAIRADDALRPIVVLTPTFLLCRHLPRMLAAQGAGHSGIRFLTMAELARLIAERSLRAEGLRPLPDGATTVLWRRAVASLPDDGFFASLKTSRGFPAAARATVRDLKDAGLTPEVIHRKARGNSRLERKLQDLVVLWRRVESTMREAGFHDDLDLFDRAAELAHESPFLEGVVPFLYGFYDLTRAQRRLVTGFMQRPIAAAFMPWGDATPAGGDARDDDFSYAGSTRDFLQGVLELQPETGDPVPLKPDPRFRVVAAPGEAREAAEIARAVAAAPGALRETGILMRVPASQAGRIDESLEDAGIPRTLTGELPSSRLPAARALRLMLEARREDFPRTIVTEILTTTPMRFEALLGDPSLPVAPGAWDVLAREWGVVAGAAEWRSRLRAGRREIERDLARDADSGPRASGPERLQRARSLEILVDRMIAAVSQIPDHGAWSAMAGGIRGAFETLFEPADGMDAVRDALDAVGRIDALGGALAEGTLAEAVELLDEALSSPAGAEGRFEGEGVLVADLMKARGLPFRTVIAPGLVEGSFPRLARPDPLLTDFERRNLNKELSAEVYDFADEAALEAAEDLGADGPLPLKGASAAEERLLFRLVLDAAKDEVVFTLSRLDPAQGRERVPSWLLLSLLERHRTPGATGALTLEEFANREEVRWLRLDPAPPDRARALTPVERDLADLSRDAGDPSGAARLLNRSPFGRSVLVAEKNRWSERRFTVHDGWLVPPPGAPAAWKEALARLAFVPGREVSATSLESWVQCPYKYFLQRGLRLDPLEEPERRMTIGHADRGDLIHRSLEKFWRSEKQGGRLPVSEGDLDAALARLDGIVQSQLDEFEANGITGPTFLWNAERVEIQADLKEAVRNTVLGNDGDGGGGFVPAEFELGFGEEPFVPAPSPLGAPRSRRRAVNTRQLTMSFGEPPPVPRGAGRVGLASASGEGSFLFRGRIDRVDLSPDGTRGRVVDYKSGGTVVKFGGSNRKDAPERCFHGGAALQLPIYVLAAKLRFPEVKDWTAIYDYCTRRGGFARPALDVSQDLLDRLKGLVQWIADDSEAGRFPFVQSDAKCPGCDYREVCGPGHDIAFEAKRESADFLPFLRRGEEFP